MTITISEITHATTGQALSYAMDYYANYYSPGDPPLTWHRFDHSEHIEVLATWGHHDLFFVQSRIKQTVLYGLPSEWEDEIAMRGWVFYCDPATGLWTTECDSTVTNLHHWQEIHHLLKKEAPNMSDILDLLIEIRDSTANQEALLNALASEAADQLLVMLKGFDPVPTNPVYDVAVNIIVPNNTWTTIASYTATAGMTFYLTDIFFAPGDPSAGPEFHYSVLANTLDRLHGKCRPGGSVAESLRTPVKLEAGLTIITRIYQWSGGNKSFHGSLIGFEV